LGGSTRALVTGASRGIGRSVAAELAARGVTVGLLARDGEALAELAAELPGDGHLVLVADVTEREGVEAAVGELIARAGGLELLVANAGIAHYGPFADMEREKTEQMVAVNVAGMLNTVGAGLAPMLDRGEGHVVIVSSGAGLRAFPNGAVYGATKAAGRAFAEALWHELSGTGVDLTTVYPGEVETHLHDHQLDRLPDWRRSDEAIDPGDLARRILDAVEGRERTVYAPAAVRILGANGVAPGLLDSLLRRVRGPSAAPRGR
jgi:short-subunit dehydrogenase